MAEGDPSDLLDALLKGKKGGPKSHGLEGEGITDDHVLMTAAEAFGAGVETTSTTLLWILAYLLHHPEVKSDSSPPAGMEGPIPGSSSALLVLAPLQVQQRVQKELDENVGADRTANLSDRGHLPYLDCVINEGMRIRPVSPVLIPHTAMTDSR